MHFGHWPCSRGQGEGRGSGQQSSGYGSSQVQASERVSSAARGWRRRPPAQRQRRLGWAPAALPLFHLYDLRRRCVTVPAARESCFQSPCLARAEPQQGLKAALDLRCQAAGRERGHPGVQLPRQGCGGSHSIHEAAVAAPEAGCRLTGQPSTAHTRQAVATRGCATAGSARLHQPGRQHTRGVCQQPAARCCCCTTRHCSPARG